MNKKDIEPLKRFKSGAILHATDLNNIYDTLSKIAKQANINLRARSPWTSGSILTADSLNNLLKDIEQVFDGLGLEKIKWSFGQFKNGTVLKAEHLNEVVDKIQECIKKLTS